MAEYEVGYKKPDPRVQFKPGNPGKPVGARMKQQTQFRHYLEKKRAVTTDGEEIDQKTFLLKKQIDEAEKGDTQAFKAVMDYAGYKPTEHVEQENRDVQEFSSEQVFESNIREIESILGITDDVVSEAQSIANGQKV